MIIIHAMNKGILPRFVADSLTDRAIEQGPLIVADAELNDHSILHVSTWLNGKRDEDDWTPIERLDPPAAKMRNI